MYWDQQKHARFEASIKALVYDGEHKLLFAQDEKGKWDLPGGRLNENESVEQCLKREVLEELGVPVKQIIRLRFSEVMDYDDKVKRLCIGFDVELESLSFKTSNENVDSRFFSKNEFDALDQAYQGLKAIKNKLYD